MNEPMPLTPAASDPDPGDRLDSWKEIAAYMRRDVKTVQRWEKREGMPVHRHLHDRLGSVFAFRSELDGWARNRRLTPAADDAISLTPSNHPEAPPPDARASADEPARAEDHTDVRARVVTAPIAGGGRGPAQIEGAVHRRWAPMLIAAGAIVALAVALLVRDAPQAAPEPLAGARFLQLTDFTGAEQAAAISADGKLVAFLSDRDGQMDVWVTQVGSGEFHNLTRGAVRELVNTSVRTLGFSPDGTSITFWARRSDTSERSAINLWAVPVLGGAPRVYLEGIAEYDWSGDGTRLVYHTPGPGDPTFVRAARDEPPGRPILTAPAGEHSHFPLWSPDGTFVYYVQGLVPDRMDIWRVSPDGGTPERITHHDAAVMYPVFLDRQTLAYLATDREGDGPWIYTVDVDRRVPRRASRGIDRYGSLSATADGHRLAATLSSVKGSIWRVPIGGEPASLADARPIPLTTANGSFPRLGADFLLYVSSKGASDSLWKLQGGRATELWSSPDTRIVGGPALARDDGRIAFSARRRDGQAALWVVNSDGTGARTLASSLTLQGAPAWSPDGQAVTIGALVDGTPSLFSVPVDGAAPVRLVHEPSSDPAWSPNGELVVFSGADVGTTFPVKAVTAAGALHRIPDLTLTRGGRRVVFLDGGRSLVVMRGELRHKDLWAVDLDTGAERQLTTFGGTVEIRDFDVAPDGRELVVEQVQEQSDVVLIDIPR